MPSFFFSFVLILRWPPNGFSFLLFSSVQLSWPSFHRRRSTILWVSLCLCPICHFPTNPATHCRVASICIEVHRVVCLYLLHKGVLSLSSKKLPSTSSHVPSRVHRLSQSLSYPSRTHRLPPCWTIRAIFLQVEPSMDCSWVFCGKDVIFLNLWLCSWLS